jgi:hypothetical protein
VEGGLEAHLRDVARARQGDREIADDARRRARRHHDHAVRERDRLLEVVGHEHHGLAVRRPQVEEQVAHDLAGLRVEGPEGLVHEQDLGIPDQHLGQRHALALAAGEHVGIAVREGREPHAPEPVAGARFGLRLGDARGLERDRDVLERGLPGMRRPAAKR